MNIKMKSLITFLIFSSLFSILNAQSYNIDYYGIVTSQVDTNLSKMTSDLYYTQLCEIQNFSVNDERVAPSLETTPDINQFSSENLSFYTEITAKGDDAWIATIHLVNKAKQKEFTKSTEYQSFYKILIEPKQKLQETIKNLVENNNSTELSSATQEVSLSSGGVSSEFLSGTWSGEDYIEKIIIMKGGRGFVIYKNGASMTVDLTVENGSSGITVTVNQKGKSNASFFPELPRNLALTAAVNAEPIKWTLNLSSNNKLTGKKRTLIAEGDSVTYKDIEVCWTKVN